MVQNRLMPSQNGSSVSTADQLLDEFQRIEQAWRRAEEKLAETRVPIDVRIKVKEGGIYDDDERSQIGCYTHYLAYTKVKGNRRICWECDRAFSQHEESECKPVAEMPVDIRIEMFDHFASLYRDAESVAKSYLPKLQAAREKFENTLEWIDL